MKRLSALLFLIVIFVLVPLQARAQSSIFEKLSGNWKGTGIVSGMNSEITMKWESVLAGKFYRLSFKNNMKGNDGNVVFEGTAFYKVKTTTETEGNWFDSFGFIRPIKAVFETDKLTAGWGTKETEEGSTVYHLVEANKLEVIDTVKGKDGNWREFGRSTFTRRRD
jgi:hypothetical protein